MILVRLIGQKISRKAKLYYNAQRSTNLDPASHCSYQR